MHLQPPQSAGKNSFTLIEVLIVVAILVLLVGLLLPNLQRSRRQAKKINCLNNLQQLAKTTQMYVDDCGYYPDAYRSGAGAEVDYWCCYYDGTDTDPERGPLGGYMQGYDVFLCPEFSTGFATLDATEATCGYGINVEYLGGNHKQTTENAILNSDPCFAAAVGAPSNTILYMDSAVDAGAGLEESFYFWARYSFAGGAYEHQARSHYRHLGFAAAVFCDGHGNDAMTPEAVDNDSLQLGWPRQASCDLE